MVIESTRTKPICKDTHIYIYRQALLYGSCCLVYSLALKFPQNFMYFHSFIADQTYEKFTYSIFKCK